MVGSPFEGMKYELPQVKIKIPKVVLSYAPKSSNEITGWNRKKIKLADIFSPSFC